MVHTDDYDNINCVLQGDKRFILIDPLAYPEVADEVCSAKVMRQFELGSILLSRSLIIQRVPTLRSTSIGQSEQCRVRSSICVFQCGL